MADTLPFVWKTLTHLILEQPCEVGGFCYPQFTGKAQFKELAQALRSGIWWKSQEGSIMKAGASILQVDDREESILGRPICTPSYAIKPCWSAGVQKVWASLPPMRDDWEVHLGLCLWLNSQLCFETMFSGMCRMESSFT